MSKPKNCISVQDAKDLQSNWMSTRAVNIERSGNQQDTCSVTFNIDDLEEYIGYVREQSEKQGIKEPGIRVYFAAYNDEKSDRATVFFCPTESEDGDSDNNYEIDPFNLGGGGWPPRSY